MTVMQGVRLGSAGVTLSDFAAHLDFSRHLIHNVEAAAEAEIWFSPQIEDAIYVSLNYDMGGSIVGFLDTKDILVLQKLIRGQSIFAPASDFIRIGHNEADIFACGAALPYIREFLSGRSPPMPVTS